MASSSVLTKRTAPVFGAIIAAGVWALPAVAFAQATATRKTPKINWVFYLGGITLLGFLAFGAFVGAYYLFAVVARNRKFATQAVTVVATAGPAPAAPPAPPKVPAPAAAPEAPAPAAAPAAPAAAPAATPAPAAAPAAAADTGGVPKVDPNYLPDGLDAVSRGRLKKLAVLQERGQAPPPELLEQLKGVLPQIQGAPAAPAAAPAAAAPAAEAPAAPAAPAEAPPAEAPAEAAPAAAADTGGVPKIDPNTLPAGIDAVARGRLKKLAVFQERGEAPPADLIEKLKPILDQIKG